MSQSRRQIHLNAFLRNYGQHEAAWRLPETNLSGLTDIGHYVELARIAEKGKLDAIFFADHPVLRDRTEDRPFDALDPVILISALAMVTERIGLVATASTTYSDPYGLARRFATLDHVSRGRAGWNIVTTTDAGAAANFGLKEHPDPMHRYQRADEFVQVAMKLWDCWDDDAVVGDKKKGIFIESRSIHPANHVGTHFSVAGPMEVPRSPQGYPVLFQAGSSGTGKDFAAKYAEAIFTAQPSLADAQAFYADVRNRIRALGRDPDRVKIMPGLSVFVAGTEEEAIAQQEQLYNLTIPTYGLALVSRIVGFKLDESMLDERFPKERLTSEFSRSELIKRILEEEELTVRQLLRRMSSARGHFGIAGTAGQVADMMEHWLDNGAADGFNLVPPALPSSLAAFVEQVVPELQRRGRFRTEYEGTTLREHLGLSRPVNSFHATAAQ